MLTPRQARFALEYAVDRNGAAAAARSGYNEKSARDIASRLLRNQEIQQRINEAAKQTAEKLRITRETALQGLLESVGLARTKGDAAGVIRGWSEVARLLGFYASQERRVKVSAARG